MKYQKVRTRLPAFILFLALCPFAMASNTWYVDGVNGNDNNDCTTSQTACQTIGHAISLTSSGDAIMVAPAIYTENLTIGISLKIIGSDPNTTIVDGGGVGSVFTIPDTNAHVTLSKLIIRNGNAPDQNSNSGGGIFSLGTLAINHCTISGNYANAEGGGIFNGRRLTINRSTISGNSGFGAGIASHGPATINNTTITGNTSCCGGGLEIGHGTATINNSTISGNSADHGGGILIYGSRKVVKINNSTISGNASEWGGGALETYTGSGGSVILQNSIVANPINCHGTIISNGYNLSSDNTCNFSGPGDMKNTEPKLGTFGNHGGPTQTVSIRSDSPAVDAGNPNGCTDDKGNLLKTDQRGKPRPGKFKPDKPCDMGAYERQKD